MSRRSLLYRKRYGDLEPNKRTAEIVMQHRPAWDNKRQLCSLPIKQEKANRLAHSAPVSHR